MNDNAQTQPASLYRRGRETDPSDVPPAVTTMVLGLSVAGRGELPPVTMTLPLGEAIHRALVRKAAGGARVNCPELTGQNALGQPLAGPHHHAHVLPVDVDRDGCIDHVVIHSGMGFGKAAVEAIRSLHTLFGRHGRPWLNFRLAGQPMIEQFTQRLLGDRLDLEGMQKSLDGSECTGSSGNLGGSETPGGSESRPHLTLADSDTSGARVWSSLSPLVAPRFVKRSGKNSLSGQVRAELASRGLPEAEVDILRVPARLFRGFVFQRSADHAPPPQRCGHALRLRFSQPTSGPICLGYGSHFGLGLFEAVE